MILTFTANPSVDATLSLDAPLARGSVHRPMYAQRSAGGKGINVANALHRAGVPTLALFPASDTDSFIALAKKADIPISHVSVTEPVRTNTAITEPDGTTTKLNEPGAELSSEMIGQLEDSLVKHAPSASAIVMSGSLPPGAPTDWYATLVDKCTQANPDVFIAVDTSDEPLQALGARLADARETAAAKRAGSIAPSLLKPNGIELGQLTGLDGKQIEQNALDGDFGPAVRAARPLIEKGVQEILLTLGGAGAVLITRETACVATPPPTTVVSTVGAGDCSLAGYLRARINGEDRATSLRWAVAYGSAAAGLPGTEIPGPDLVNFSETTVQPISMSTWKDIDDE